MRVYELRVLLGLDPADTEALLNNEEVFDERPAGMIDALIQAVQATLRSNFQYDNLPVTVRKVYVVGLREEE